MLTISRGSAQGSQPDPRKLQHYQAIHRFSWRYRLLARRRVGRLARPDQGHLFRDLGHADEYQDEVAL